ncbi:MAG: hypothetical protein PHX60_11305 [Giesbergeria sp.]|nr:hypothetical protein [Giesbergeria sp.]MDD2610250.1 hypothetical protein [Giesbergeria sp.]
MTDVLFDIAEMKLNQAPVQEDYREKLRALRAEFAARAATAPRF